MRFLLCFSQDSLCTVSVDSTVLSVSTVVSIWIPHFPTSVVLRSDRQDGNGCFGSRIVSVCHKSTSHRKTHSKTKNSNPKRLDDTDDTENTLYTTMDSASNAT